MHKLVTERCQCHTIALSSLGGVTMANLKEEYVDVKSVRHRVEHIMLPPTDQNALEQILEELIHVLSKTKAPPQGFH